MQIIFLSQLKTDVENISKINAGFKIALRFFNVNNEALYIYIFIFIMRLYFSSIREIILNSTSIPSKIFLIKYTFAVRYF
jgi:hypothetical protein